MKTIILLLFSALLSFSIYAQETTNGKSIEASIDSIYDVSSSWELYKLVRKERYQWLKKEVLDSLKMYKNDIRVKSQTIASLEDSLSANKIVLDELNMDLKLSLDRRNEIKFLGISFAKTTYQLLVWSLVLILFICLGYYIYKFNNSHVVTKNAQNELADLEEEFAAFKKKAMTKEQKLRRQLQDEINKQRGV